MKEIKAFIKPHKLQDVTLALQKVQALRGMSVEDVKGFGRRCEENAPCPKPDELLDFSKYVKVELFCNDDLVDEIITIIDEKAYTGLPGDGKVYVLDVTKAYKIGKGEIQGNM